MDSSKYSQVLFLSEIFEKLYKKYDRDYIVKKAENLFDIINKLKKELRKYEIGNIERAGNSEKKIIKKMKMKYQIKYIKIIF